MDADLAALIDDLPELRGRPVRIQVLTGGLTNLNYRLESGDEVYVLRVPGENTAQLGIDRQIEYASAQAAYRSGAGPEVVAVHSATGAILTRFVAGKTVTTEDLRSPGLLQRVVASLKRYHNGTGGGGVFSALETIHTYCERAAEYGVEFPPEVKVAMDRLAFIALEVGNPSRVVPCHNDLLAANFIDDGRQVWVLDWEYAGSGDLFFDLGNLAANGQFTLEQEMGLLGYYFGRVDQQDLERLHLMRRLSYLREAMWGFLQLGVSKLDFDFRAYGERHLTLFMKS
ncbi:MAG TPA: phosphotransferase [Candidatus Limnocylindria bacterium]|jgi:thiamine kinase-like enzyme|nr:phosphotransferase [Candidatus Limnocylindria bacterium]